MDGSTHDATCGSLHTTCAIVGGGPAGMMLGYLLARAGVGVVVLEKHADFLRDFRGDTIHPSTLELMHELGILEQFLARPHQEARKIQACVGGEMFQIADFTHLPTHCKFIAFMPQWDFLNFIAEQAKSYAQFDLRMQVEVLELIEEQGNVVGVRANSPQGPLVVRADLVIGADGRHSTVRQQAGLVVEDIGAPIDVLWMRLPRHAGDPEQLVGRFDRGLVLVLIDRGDYWQAAFIIHKGAYEQIRAAGLSAFRESIARIAPFLSDRVGELKDWEQIRLLTVAVDRLQKWYRPGLLCLGDAAHAMSPVGGVGINLAIQDAVAAANMLAEPLAQRRVTLEQLAAIQQRRTLPTKVIQSFQVFVHRRFLSKVIAGDRPTRLPWFMRLALGIPWTRRIPAFMLGIGVRPEHVRTANVHRP
jgi:2-polyprenyl-6-methoxyphenol hydroxylase-like FAD-dependent oxidoreductase